MMFAMYCRTQHAIRLHSVKQKKEYVAPREFKNSSKLVAVCWNTNHMDYTLSDLI